MTKTMLRTASFVMVMAAPVIARADPTADAKASAEVLFQQGRSLIEEGKIAEACPKLEESNRLDVGIGTMLYLADCWEQLGRTASAWAQFVEAESLAKSKGDARESIAHARAAALAPKLAKLTLQIAPDADAPGLAVTRDGFAVGRPTWGTPVPIDPGEHVITASAPSKQSWSTTVRVEPLGVQQVAIPRLVDAPSPPPPPDTRPRSDGSTQRTIGLVIGGVGVVGLGVGTYFGLHAKDRNDASNADGHCVGNSCDSIGYDARNEARSSALASTILFVVGAAAVTGGTILYFTAPKNTQIALSPTGAAVRCSF